MAIQLSQDDDRFTVTDAELVAGGDAETSYTIRPLTREVRKRVVKEHTTRQANPRTRAMEDRVDAEAIGLALLDYALVGWSGILWQGQPAPCEKDYKLKLDEVRLSAILEQAGLSRIVDAEAARGESFRSPA